MVSNIKNDIKSTFVVMIYSANNVFIFMLYILYFVYDLIIIIINNNNNNNNTVYFVCLI